MTANINERTGIPYGVISAHRVPYLYEQITQEGEDLTHQEGQHDLLDRLLLMLDDLDVPGAYLDITRGDERIIFAQKLGTLQELFRDGIQRAWGEVPTRVLDSTLDLVDIESGAFDPEEVANHLLGELNELDSHEDSGEHDYQYQSGQYQYRLSHLGGAPLIWVVSSPYVTYCRTCSPCVPNAGDLDNCCPYGEANNLAYCVDPLDIQDEEERPPVWTVDLSGQVSQEPHLVTEVGHS